MKSRSGLRRHLSGQARYGGHELSADAAQAISALPALEHQATVSGLRCPLCGKVAKAERGLRRHLVGTLEYGGHALPGAAAATVAARTAAAAVESGDPSEAKSWLETALELLSDSASIPKYQLERAIDGFLRAFLPEILDIKLGGTHECVVPEFPLKKETSNQTTNLDYLYYDTERNRWVWIELKTDARSLREDQFQAYGKYILHDMASLVKDVRTVKDAASSPETKFKYEHVLDAFGDRPLDGDRILVVISPEEPVRTNWPASLCKTEVILLKELLDLKLKRFPQEWEIVKKRLFRPRFGPA